MGVVLDLIRDLDLDRDFDLVLVLDLELDPEDCLGSSSPDKRATILANILENQSQLRAFRARLPEQ